MDQNVLSCYVCLSHISQNSSNSLYLCKFNSDLYEIKAQDPGVPTGHPNLYNQFGLPPNGNYNTWDSPNYQKIPFSLPIQLGSLWNFKFELLGYQQVIPSCLINFGYPQISTLRHVVIQIIKKSLYLCQFNSDLNVTLNSSSWDTKVLSQLV